MLLLTGFVSFGDDFATSTLDVMGQMLMSFNVPILLILGVALVGLVISMVLRSMLQ